jgi:hypothetical protein
LAEALRDMLELHVRGTTWDEAVAGIHVRYRRHSWVHAINNSALVAAGLLWGEGDYAATVGLTV